jgi:hypothetical protein
MTDKSHRLLLSKKSSVTIYVAIQMKHQQYKSLNCVKTAFNLNSIYWSDKKSCSSEAETLALFEIKNYHSTAARKHL